MEPLEERIRRVVREEIAIVPYDDRWPEMFRREKQYLLSCLPADLVRRVEHFGSTAVPGLAAKPVLDIMAGVARTPWPERTLGALGYQYRGDSGVPGKQYF